VANLDERQAGTQKTEELGGNVQRTNRLADAVPGAGGLRGLIGIDPQRLARII
jgi:hypothetical protein